jgi:4-hydroxy-tetrahydrodipicolinate reductase
MINLVIHGHRGRLATKVIKNLQNQTTIRYVGYIDRLYDLTILRLNTDVVILDISSDEGCKNLLINLTKQNIRIPIIIGSTGNLPNELIEEYSKNNTVYQISNFGEGINKILNSLKSLILSNSSIEITETHHIHKKDAPSGTAKTLADEINVNYSEIVSYRESNVIGVHTITIKNEYEKKDILLRQRLNLSSLQ